MEEKQLVINRIKRALGQLYIRLGIQQVWEGISDFSDVEGDYNRFTFALKGIPSIQQDTKYYFTSFENWRKIMDTINPMTVAIPWKADRRDCDKRAMFVTAMVSFLFDINTCRPVYCNVYRVGDGKFAYAHKANLFVDTDGTCWLWDADQEGKYTKITSTTPIIDNKKYELLKVE